MCLAKEIRTRSSLFYSATSQKKDRTGKASASFSLRRQNRLPCKEEVLPPLIFCTSFTSYTKPDYALPWCPHNALELSFLMRTIAKWFVGRSTTPTEIDFPISLELSAFRVFYYALSGHHKRTVFADHYNSFHLDPFSVSRDLPLYLRVPQRISIQRS